MIEVKKNNFFLNEEVNTILKDIIKNKSFANGYIFYGAEGVGKKQTALNFIKEIFKQCSSSKNAFLLDEHCLKISFIKLRAVCFFPTPSAP